LSLYEEKTTPWWTKQEIHEGSKDLNEWKDGKQRSLGVWGCKRLRVRGQERECENKSHEIIWSSLAPCGFCDIHFSKNIFVNYHKKEFQLFSRDLVWP
jgi:hypothetical protein